MDTALIIFLKAPRPRLVKTRLAESLGPEAAALIYQQLVRLLLNSLDPLETVELRFAPDDAAAEISHWLRPGWAALPQGEGGLGIRLARAFQEAFRRGAERVVVIGSDCPAITLEDIRRAWDGLREHDLVLGPASDGGYWLVGLTRPHPELFENISWSTEAVLRETLERAEKAGLRTELLRALSDVDTVEDWNKFAAGDHLL